MACNRGFWAAVVLALAAPAAGDEAAAAPVPPADAMPSVPAAQTEPRAGASWLLRTGAREDYRFRGSTSPDESDQKAHLAIDAGAVDPSERISITGALDLWWDLDGRAPAGSPWGQATVWDRRSPWLDVLALSADWRPGGVVRALRAGRQETAHGPPVTFDGAYVSAGATGGRLELYAFGGRQVHFFQVVPGDFESWLASAGATLRATPLLRFDLDYRWTRERVALPGGDALTTDQGIGLTAHWRVGETLRTRAAVRTIDGRVSTVAAAAALRLPWALSLDLAASAQPVALRDVSEAETAYFATLGESLPYARGSVVLSRPFRTAAGSFDLNAGWQGRALLDGTPGPFNRNLGRAWLLASGAGLGGTGFFASASVERVSDDALLAGEGLWAVNGSAGWAGGGLRAEVGTQYQRYRYTYYQDAEEVADVRSVFGEARWRLSPRFQLRARYARDASDRVVQTFFVGAAQAFE